MAVTLDTQETSVVNIFKFAVLQKMAIEYYMAIEEPLANHFEIAMSTQYKNRFTANAKEKRRIEKELAAEIKTFKARAKAYRQKNDQMYEMLDSFRHTERDSIEECVEEIYEFIDQLILKRNG